MFTTLTTKATRTSVTMALLFAFLLSAFVFTPNTADAARFSEYALDANISCNSYDGGAYLTLISPGVIGEVGNPIANGNENPISETAYSAFTVYRWEGQWVYQSFTEWEALELKTTESFGVEFVDVDPGYYYAAVSYVAHDFDGQNWQYEATLALVEEGTPGAAFYSYCG
jgi:hypothetical protein